MAAKVEAAKTGVRRIGDGMGLSGIGAALSVVARIGAVGGCCLALAHCGGPVSSKVDPKYGVSASPRVVQFGEPVPKGGGTYRVGKPYMVGGQTYSPEENTAYKAEGIASWYGDDFHGRRTANGEVYDMQSISAAHPTLPIPSYARVTNLSNQRSIIVRVNDRGPYHAGRLIDLSARTARLLDFKDHGTARVRVEYVGRASLAGSDDTRLEATLRRGTPAPGPAEIKLAASQAFAVRSEGAAIRGAVPTPAERPFELGHNQNSARIAGRANVQGHAQGNVQANVQASAAVERGPIAPVATPSRQAAAPAKQVAAGERSNFDARFAPANAGSAMPGQAGPVSAYAAPSQGAVMSGRGLY
jgi:rare lipoprotein A